MADLKSFAQIQIGGKKKKYPSKKTINLIVKENRAKKNLFAIVVFLIFMALLAVFTKFMVLDKIDEVNQAEAAYNEKLESLNALKEQNNNYDTVKEEYSHYGNSMLNDDELSLQDRAKMMDVIDQKVRVDSGIQSIVISGNTASLIIEKTTLSEVSDVVAALESSDIVQYVAPSTAERTEKDTESVISSSGEETLVADPQKYVTATIVVTFTSPYTSDSSDSQDEESLADKMRDNKAEVEQEGMTDE
ncbi:MAG: hypothetical protein SOH80_00055 [Eubacteriales bacterium]